jgi:hypothetical protein
MNEKKKDYVVPSIEVMSFASADIVTSSPVNGWLESDGNIDHDGWT